MDYGVIAAGFKHAPFQHPTIIIIDNDDGAKNIFSVLSKFNININYKTEAPFYHIIRNLYLIKTPEAASATGWSQIEDLFDAKTLSIKLGGKAFNKKNDTDTATEYGKAYFAEHVVAPNAGAIDFSGFSPLLDRIVSTIIAHQQRVAAGAV
jgi:hypothetical protein